MKDEKRTNLLDEKLRLVALLSCLMSLVNSKIASFSLSGILVLI